MKELRFVFDRKPGATFVFVEVEDETGKSRNVGQWREREDGLWELVVIMDTIC
jgi:hypothetical protein